MRELLKIAQERSLAGLLLGGYDDRTDEKGQTWVGVRTNAALVREVKEIASKLALARVAAARHSDPAEARYQQLAKQVDDLAKAREYAKAMETCEQAGKDSAVGSFAERFVRAQNMLKGCQRVMARAGDGAKGLVGKTYSLEIRAGKTGRMRATGEVLSFQDETLALQVGVRPRKIPLAGLGTNDIARLAEAAGVKAWQDRLDLAAFLFAERDAETARERLRDLQPEVKDDATARAACDEMRRFFDQWRTARASYGPAREPRGGPIAVATNEAGDRLEILSINPPLPAKLAIGQRLTVGISYRLSSAESCQIFIRPYTRGRRSRGYSAHGSRFYRKGQGQVEGFFALRGKGIVDEIRVEMLGRNRDSLLLLRKRIRAEWQR